MQSIAPGSETYNKLPMNESIIYALGGFLTTTGEIFDACSGTKYGGRKPKNPKTHRSCYSHSA
jgi:hypothetical protein